uniref:Fungal lipase-like domain-containing protein n=1 Tax=Plectus sambesii TaxID=2011161 RepID=A0A914VRU3_9BILA
MASLTVLFLILSVVTSSYGAAIRYTGANQYDETLARRMLDMSAAAYSQSPQNCFNQTFPVGQTWQVRNDFNTRCDFIKDFCSAFIAVSDDQREIVIAFRGTNTNGQLLLEGLESLAPEILFNNMGHVMKYFYDGFLKVWPEISEALTTNDNNYNVIFTGHSLGGALASLAAAQTVAQGYRLSEQVKLITFGQPRVGDHSYAMAHDRYVPYSYRVVHKADLVPHLPSCSEINNECANKDSAPYHHGTEVWYTDGMAPDAHYELCTDGPTDEDRYCSNDMADKDYSITDHLHYFEHMVSHYGENGCVDGAIVSCACSFSLVLFCLILLVSYRNE